MLVIVRSAQHLADQIKEGLNSCLASGQRSHILWLGNETVVSLGIASLLPAQGRS
jgi:hypothetical protein